VSVGPQSEIDVWEQIDYRDEQRRQRSNSAESIYASQDVKHRLDLNGAHSFTNETLLNNEQDEKILRTIIEEPRVRYDVEVVTKLIVYGGTISLHLF
jgi:dihydrosphingosine 1-phosphate phosphatase